MAEVAGCAGRLLERQLLGEPQVWLCPESQIHPQLFITFLSPCTGAAVAEVAGYAGRLLERSLLGELRAVVARALSGLDMFSGDLSELLAGDAFSPGSSPPEVHPLFRTKYECCYS